MVVVAGEDDGLAEPRAVGVADAVLHQVAQDDAVGVLVEDGLVDLLLARNSTVSGSASCSSSCSRCSGVSLSILDAVAQKRGGVLDL